MPNVSANTPQLHDWLDRSNAGDLVAREELLRAVCDRLEQLARRMLRRFPAVRPWAQTEDVLQSSLIRLLHALQEVRPGCMREFFSLAAVQMRRELLDLARHFQGRRGEGREPAERLAPPQGRRAAEPLDAADDDTDLERWSAFHEATERLPAAEREVVGLIFYHDWPRAKIAELFGVDERTIRRRWHTACRKLHEALRAGIPE